MSLHIQALWLCIKRQDMRCGADSLLAQVLREFGQAKTHHAYLFANKRASRMKLVLCDETGVWVAAKRLHTGKFVWPDASSGAHLSITREQWSWLTAGAPWQHLGREVAITQV
jgi:transposase